MNKRDPIIPLPPPTIWEQVGSGILVMVIGPRGGGLIYKTDGDARRLA